MLVVWATTVLAECFAQMRNPLRGLTRVIWSWTIVDSPPPVIITPHFPSQTPFKYLIRRSGLSQQEDPYHGDAIKLSPAVDSISTNFPT